MLALTMDFITNSGPSGSEMRLTVPTMPFKPANSSSLVGLPSGAIGRLAGDLHRRGLRKWKYAHGVGIENVHDLVKVVKARIDLGTRKHAFKVHRSGADVNGTQYSIVNRRKIQMRMGIPHDAERRQVQKRLRLSNHDQEANVSPKHSSGIPKYSFRNKREEGVSAESVSCFFFHFCKHTERNEKGIPYFQ